MASASTEKIVLGSIAFAVFWILAVFPEFPLLPIGRTAGSLVGAMLMIIFKVISPDQAYAAIDLPVLGLLFGTMVVGIYLERADMFKYLGILLSWRCWGARDLLCRICLVSAFSSALFTNDTICIVLTEFVLKLARQNNVPPHPFLLALASSANIGSSATPIGNPQNLVIAIKSGISFWGFLLGLLPAMLVGVIVNAGILICMYWKVLSVEKDEENAITSLRSQECSNNIPMPEPARNSTTDSEEAVVIGILQVGGEEIKGRFSKRWRIMTWKMCVYLVTIGMLIALLMGLDMSWTALTAALALVVLDFKDAGPCLDKVSYSLLIFFCGMFITVEGFNKTGIPSTLWNLTKPYAQINHATGIMVLSFAILVLSNVASNVPTVLLLGASVAASTAGVSESEEKKTWLILAWVSTVAGNLSLLGSAANLIVCEQARRAHSSAYYLSFWRHLKFGVPSTLIVTTIGLTLIRG